MRTILLAFLLLAHAALADIARGTTVDDLCSPPGSPQGAKPCACIDATTCEVRSKADVANNSTLDFGARDLVLKQRSALNVGGGLMIIKAANVTLEGGSALQGVPPSGVGGAITVEATAGDISVFKDAIIDVGGDPAGRVDLDALGDVRIAGMVRAKGTSESDGGTIAISGNTIDISGTLDFSGQGAAFAGDATLLAVAGFGLAGTVEGNGESGGTLDIDTSTGEVSTTAQIRLQATRAGGDGGTIGIVAAGHVVLGGQLRLAGDGSGEGGGSGGAVDVDAGGPIQISATLIDLSGAPPTGTGGDFFLTSAGDIIVTSSLELQAQSRGSAGDGGLVDLDSEGSIQLPGILAFGGASGRGGTVYALAWCDLTLPAGRTIDTSGGNLTGDTTLSAGEQTTVAGRLFATVENRVEFRDPGKLPVLGAGPFQPPVNQVPVPELIPCGGPIIPGCGNGVVAAPEECDDGNTDPCDGCSRSCKKEECGNGDIECGEQCDDGNKADCDRCHGDCLRLDNICGDGLKECGEERDDGNLAACDGVSAECRVEGCGNTIAECAEQCDAGPAGSPACSPQCLLQVPPNCADGVVQTADGESCDDGNTADCDGCSRFCQLDGCGNGVIEAACSETCDDFNTRAGDGCSNVCQGEVCGNGRKDEGEDCDDGNANECDACFSDCTKRDPLQPCPVCTSGSTEPCIACAEAIDCDPLRACGTSACVAGVCTPVAPPDCNDGNLCTTDSCDPASGCVSTPVVCQDSTACDGTLSCDPATGQCANGPAPGCDDGDACTDDTCTEGPAGATCRSDLRPGLDGARCRLNSLQSLIESANVPKGTRKKLRAQAKRILKKLPALAGMGKKATKARKQIANGLKALDRTVAKARKKIDADTMTRLRAAIGSTSAAVASL